MARVTFGGFSRSTDDELPVFVISVAAELAGMHAQTLRQYDRLGLVTPSRTRGGGRRYSRVHSPYSGRYKAATPTQVADAAE